MRLPHGGIETTATGLRITVEREVGFGLEEIWNAFTTAEGLKTWIGVLRGSLESGNLTFAMVEQEQESTPAKVSVRHCRAPHELAVTTESEYGDWNLGLELSRKDGVSTIRFIQDIGLTEDPSTIGPGWEYYLQRVILSLEGGDVDLVPWDDFYPALAPAYTVVPE